MESSKPCFQKKNLMYSIGETMPILFNSFLEIPEEGNLEDGERNEHIALRKTLLCLLVTQELTEMKEVKPDLNKQVSCCE